MPGFVGPERTPSPVPPLNLDPQELTRRTRENDRRLKILALAMQKPNGSPMARPQQSPSPETGCCSCLPGTGSVNKVKPVNLS